MGKKLPEIRLIHIPWDQRAIFVKRPNRFLAICKLIGSDHEVKVHVRDPGRLKELLFPGNSVLIKRAVSQNRKTSWDLIAALSSVDKDKWVLVNSGYHSLVAKEIFKNPSICPFGELHTIKPEVKLQNSRLDFLIKTKKSEEIYIEVKGCTLGVNGKALFPDAPTSRGARHLNELSLLSQKGIRASVIFLIFCPGISCFEANRKTDPIFASSFKQAISNGVETYCFHLEYNLEGFVNFCGMIPLCKD